MKPIPQYDIIKLQRMFGKQGDRKDYFFVSEDAFDLYDYEPFRTETYGIVFLRNGSFVLNAGLERIFLTAPCIYAMGPDVIRRVEHGDKQPVLDIVFFTRAFFLKYHSDVFFLSKFKFFEINQPHSFPLNNLQLEKFTQLFDQIRHLLAEGNLHEEQIINSFFNILIHETDVLYQKLDRSVDPDKIAPLVSMFKALLIRSFKSERTVGYYADQLNVSAKYLSEYLKAKTGRNASQWINEAVVLEAKVLLQRRESTVAQVSEQLNFSDQSVFGKFFKAHVNKSPAAYRKTMIS